MFQRTVYAGIIGLSGLVGIAGALRPWVQDRFTMVVPEDVSPVHQLRSGLEPFTLVLSILLVCFAFWVWFERDRRNLLVASLLVLSSGVLLALIAALAFVDIDGVITPSSLSRVPIGTLPGEPYFPITSRLREGVHLTATAGALAVVVGALAALLYRPARDQPGPDLWAAARRLRAELVSEPSARSWLLGLVSATLFVVLSFAAGAGGAITALAIIGAMFYPAGRGPSLLRTAARPFLFGLPALVYLALAGWMELGQSSPGFVIRLPQSSQLELFHEPFRHLAAPPVLAGLVIGVAAGLASEKFRQGPVLASVLVIIIYATFLAYDGSWGTGRVPCRLPCYDIVHSMPQHVYVTSSEVDEVGRNGLFRIGAEVLGIMAGIVVLSIWGGYGVALLLRGIPNGCAKLPPRRLQPNERA